MLLIPPPFSAIPESTIVFHFVQIVRILIGGDYPWSARFKKAQHQQQMMIGGISRR